MNNSLHDSSSSATYSSLQIRVKDPSGLTLYVVLLHLAFSVSIKKCGANLHSLTLQSFLRTTKLHTTLGLQEYSLTHHCA